MTVAADGEEFTARLHSGNEKLDGDEHENEEQDPGRERPNKRLAEGDSGVFVCQADRGLVGQDECESAEREQCSECCDEGVDADHRDEECVDDTDYESGNESRDNAQRKVRDAGHDDAGDGQGAGHTQVEFTHQDDCCQAQSDDADQGDAAQCDVVGGQGERLKKRDHDDDEGQQHNAASLGASRRSSPNATPRARRLVGAQRNRGTHRWATLRARASKETASTISTPSATCW